MVLAYLGGFAPARDVIAAAAPLPTRAEVVAASMHTLAFVKVING